MRAKQVVYFYALYANATINVKKVKNKKQKSLNNRQFTNESFGSENR